MSATARQLEVLERIQSYVEEHGRPPSVRQIAALLGVSAMTAHQHLAGCEDAGLLERCPCGSGRFVPVEEAQRWFVTFREDNAWEGETWRFYIPVEGNGDALSRLAELVDAAGSDYRMEAPLSEADVDVRVDTSDDNGYLPAHIKLTGRLVLPDDVDTTVTGWEDELFYKGRIADLVQP